MILTVGDASGDGHGKEMNFTITTPLGVHAQELIEAYARGTEKIGWDFAETICAEYENSSIPAAKLTQLRKLGYTGPCFEETYYESLTPEKQKLFKPAREWDLAADEFVAIWLFIAKLGGVEAHIDKPETLYIGGYGCFS